MPAEASSPVMGRRYAGEYHTGTSRRARRLRRRATARPSICRFRLAFRCLPAGFEKGRNTSQTRLRRPAKCESCAGSTGSLLLLPWRGGGSGDRSPRARRQDPAHQRLERDPGDGQPCGARQEVQALRAPRVLLVERARHARQRERHGPDGVPDDEEDIDGPKHRERFVHGSSVAPSAPAGVGFAPWGGLHSRAARPGPGRGRSAGSQRRGDSRCRGRSPGLCLSRGGTVSETSELMEVCAAAARRGGEVLLGEFGRRRTIEYKSGIDLVTDADRASETALLEFLTARHPAAAILAEESGASGAPGGRLRFIVDPLDGTTNYAHGLPHFAVNVGVEDEVGLVAGATYDPVRDDLFLGARGQGATLNGEPVAASSRGELGRSLLCTGFPYDIHENPELPLRLFSAYMTRARAIRRMGSAALDLAYVACGRFDGFWEMKLKPWDLAPGILLVREAGGGVADFLGGQRMLEAGQSWAAN